MTTSVIKPSDINLLSVSPTLEYTELGWLNETSVNLFGPTSVNRIISDGATTILQGVSDYYYGINVAPDDSTITIQNFSQPLEFASLVDDTVVFEDDIQYKDQDMEVSSKVVKQVLNIDTRFRKNYNHLSTSFTYNFPEPQKNVLNMRIGSIDMPISYYSISANLGNNTMLIVSDITKKERTLDISGSWYLDTQLGFMSTTYKYGTIMEDTERTFETYIENDLSGTKITYYPSLTDVTITKYSNTDSPANGSTTTDISGTMAELPEINSISVRSEYPGTQNDTPQYDRLSGLLPGYVSFEQSDITVVVDDEVGKMEHKYLRKTIFHNNWLRLRQRKWKEGYYLSRNLYSELSELPYQRAIQELDDIEEVNTIFPEGNPNRNDIDVSGNTEYIHQYSYTKHIEINQKRYIDLKTKKIVDNFTPVSMAWLVTIPDGYYDSTMSSSYNQGITQTIVNDAIKLAVPGAIDLNNNFAAFYEPEYDDWLNYDMFSDLRLPLQTNIDITFNLNDKNAFFKTGGDYTTITTIIPKFIKTDAMSNLKTQYGNDDYENNSLNGTPYQQMSLLYNESFRPKSVSTNIGTNPKRIQKVVFNVDQYGNIDNDTNLQLKLGWMLGFRKSEYNLE